MEKFEKMKDAFLAAGGTLSEWIGASLEALDFYTLHGKNPPSGAVNALSDAARELYYLLIS